MLPEPIKKHIKDPHRWVEPEALNVSPQLVGQPLALPVRRAFAMGLDLLVIALLTGVSGLWLLGGLAMVLLQLRAKGRVPTGRRAAVGWVIAGVVVLLAGQEAISQFNDWRHPGRARHAQSSEAADEAMDQATEGAADAAESLADAAAESRAASAPAVVIAALDQAAAAASAAAVKAGASAAAAAATASAPDQHQIDQARIAKLQAQLAQSRKPKSLKQQLQGLLDEIGAGLGWGIVYFSMLPAWWGGQTVGKKVFGLKVVELTGKPMTVMRCLKRYGGYAAGLATGGLGLAQVLWDPNRQGLQDKAAHTVVIDLRGQPRPPAAAPAAAPIEDTPAG